MDQLDELKPEWLEVFQGLVRKQIWTDSICWVRSVGVEGEAGGGLVKDAKGLV